MRTTTATAAAPQVKPRPMTEQELHNAAQIAAATSFTAYIRFGGAPQTLEAADMLEAGMLALIMHRECVNAASHPVGVPCVYAMPAHGGPGVLVPIADWLPPVLDRLSKRSAGTYEPHPDIAREARMIGRLDRRGF